MIRKLYYKLAKLVGYVLMFEDTYNWETFEIDTKYSHLSLYKYLGKYQHDGSLRLKRVWSIKIR